MSADIDYTEREAFEAVANMHGVPTNSTLALKMFQAGASWQARASIPQAPAEHQQRAKDQHAHDIGMAHIICDQAGIPPGKIIARLVALSGKGDDSARLDWLEERGNESDGLLLHAGNQNTGGRCGLGLIRTGRTLRQAVDSARGIKVTATPQTAPSQAKSAAGKEES